jgi:hypothetical protein
MGKNILIRIPVIVGSNGLWGAVGSAEEMSNPDWNFISEKVADFSEHDVKYPSFEMRYWVTAVVEVPTVDPVEVDGIAMQTEEKAR